MTADASGAHVQRVPSNPVTNSPAAHGAAEGVAARATQCSVL
jgi:hypothetical protein